MYFTLLTLNTPLSPPPEFCLFLYKIGELGKASREIWDHLTARIFDAEQFCLNVEKRFEASFMAKIAKKGFLKN